MRDTTLRRERARHGSTRVDASCTAGGPRSSASRSGAAAPWSSPSATGTARSSSACAPKESATGSKGFKPTGPDVIREHEPRASAEATSARWCPSTGYVDPFEVAIAAAENAAAMRCVHARGAGARDRAHRRRGISHRHRPGGDGGTRSDQRGRQRMRGHLPHGGRRDDGDDLAPGQHRRARP